MVDRNVLRSPCMASAGRSKRQTNPADLVHFNTSLLTAALISSQSDIQNVCRILLEYNTSENVYFRMCVTVCIAYILRYRLRVYDQVSGAMSLVNYVPSVQWQWPHWEFIAKLAAKGCSIHSQICILKTAEPIGFVHPVIWLPIHVIETGRTLVSSVACDFAPTKCHLNRTNPGQLWSHVDI